MYFKNKLLFLLFLCLFIGGCSSLQNGFLGLAPAGDRKAYTHARDLFGHEDYEQAAKELTTYIYKIKNVKRREARAYRLLGQSYERLGQSSKALEVYLEALEFHPNNVPLLVEAAKLYQNSQLWDQAQNLFERALQQEPSNLEALSGLAHNYHLVGFNSKARELYDRFFELNPAASPLYRARYAQTFLEQYQYEPAFVHITMALSEDNTNPDFWLLSAKALYGQNKTEEALKNLDTALLFAPNRHDLLATKALWLYQAEQYDDSLSVTKQMLEYTPDNQLALFIQALNYYKKGQKSQAKKLLTRVQTIDANSFIGQVSSRILE